MSKKHLSSAQITPRTFKAYVDRCLTSEALTEPINKDIRCYLHFQDGKWHLQREVHVTVMCRVLLPEVPVPGPRLGHTGICSVSKSSDPPERGSRGKWEARPKAGTGEKVHRASVPTSHSRASKPSDTSVSLWELLPLLSPNKHSFTLNKVKGTIKAPEQRVSWRTLHSPGKSANNYLDPFVLLLLLFVKACGFCDRRKAVTSNTGGILPLTFYLMS